MPRPSFLPGGASPWTRRSFLTGTASFAAAAWLAGQARRARGAGGPALAGPPFTLGVASGDPAPDGVVLWTRLAPRPLDPDGGAPPEPVRVAWEVAADEGFARIVQRGTTLAEPGWAHAVHVEVGGLRPDRWYWYRFHAAGFTSPTGRTRTLPPAAAAPDRLRFAFASCQKYEIGHYTAYEHLAREDLDLVVHLGDYIYEKGDDRRAIRPHGLPEVRTLEDYRRRYALYKTDPALQAAHAMAPWIVTWDDHEVSNDYADAVHEEPADNPPEEFLRRRAAAYQAYFEHMPLRSRSRPRGPDLRLYRRVPFGTLAMFHVLDTRQYRTDQPPGPRRQSPGPATLDPSATILGAGQRQWLFDGLARPGARWNALAQQVLMAPVDRAVGEEESVDVDKWAGYEHERRLLLRHLRDGRVANPVVLTGDIHSNWANELLLDGARRDEAPAAVEFVGTSISSSGDGSERPDYTDAILAENPFVKFHNGERGYVRCEVTARTWRTDFQTIPYVSRPGAPRQTRASFVVEAGHSLLQRA